VRALSVAWMPALAMEMVCCSMASWIATCTPEQHQHHPRASRLKGGMVSTKGAVVHKEQAETGSSNADFGAIIRSGAEGVKRARQRPAAPT